MLSPRRRQEHEGFLCVFAVMSSWVSSRPRLSIPILKRDQPIFSAHSTISFCGIPHFTVLFLSLLAFIGVHSRLPQILTLPGRKRENNFRVVRFYRGEYFSSSDTENVPFRKRIHLLPFSLLGNATSLGLPNWLSKRVVQSLSVWHEKSGTVTTRSILFEIKRHQIDIWRHSKYI